MTLTRWPLPRMYNFLLDDLHAHVANAKNAVAARDREKYLVEVEKAHLALSDLQILLDEFKSDKRRR